MPRHKNKVQLTEDERKGLEKVTRSRTSAMQTVMRAKILLYKNSGLSNAVIAERLEINRNSVSLCLNKYYKDGVKLALIDAPKTGRPAIFTDDDITYVIDLACQKPVSLGYAAELWTQRALQRHIREHCVEAGHPALANIACSKVCDILNKAEIKPHRIKYYLEKRDPDFESKKHDVLMVYKQVELMFDDEGCLIPFEGAKTVTISYDEKPGIQALGCTSPDQPPTLKHGFIARDSEYIRHGTLSLLAGMDLLSGEIIPLVSPTHKSADFISLLKKLDEKYPLEDTIRLVLDNHSAHTSKETRKYLATRPSRFEFVFTPKHGSWLNLIESFFSKMTRQMLRGIRVESKQALEDRIYKYIEQLNQEPVIYHWKYNLDEISLGDYA